MSACWKVKGSSPKIGEVQVWWTASRAPSVFVRRSKNEVADDREREFQSMVDVDEWAMENGVTFWEAMETVRAFPFAEKLPIVFPDAPPANILEIAIERFASGEKLDGIANDFSVDVGLLRYWMVGADPTNASLKGLKARRKDATTNQS